MLFEGDSEVLKRLFYKKHLLAEGNPEHEKIRPALLILSGVMRGAYGGGQVSALERFDLNDVFDTVVGISTGAPTAAYFLAQQAILGTTIYSEECTTPDFLSLSRFIRGAGSIMDTGHLISVFRGLVSNKKLDQEKIFQSRSRFLVGVTCADTAEGEFLDTRKCSDMIEAIHASLSTPGISQGQISLDGRTWTDGVVALQFPAQKLIEEYQPTDVLVLANRDSTWQPSGSFSLEKMLLPLFFAKFPEPVRRTFESRNEQFAHGLQTIREQKIRSAIVWTDKELGKFERNPKKLESAALRAETHLSQLLAAAEAAAEASS